LQTMSVVRFSYVCIILLFFDRSQCSHAKQYIIQLMVYLRHQNMGISLHELKGLVWIASLYGFPQGYLVF